LSSLTFFKKELERDETAEAGVLSLEDHTHTTVTEFLGHLVMTDGSPQRELFSGSRNQFSSRYRLPLRGTALRMPQPKKGSNAL
jgi:hypothetical protein